MKTFKLLCSFFGFFLFAMVIASFRYPSPTEMTALKPDLRVSAIVTPGGLCPRPNNKVRVNITNSQMAAVKEKIPVTLFVSPQQGQPSSYVAYLEKGIGPKNNYGQPVWFDNVKLDYGGRITLRAVVNIDKEIEETSYNNNDKLVKVNAKDNCGGGNATTNTEGAKLEVTAYVDGTWSGGNYQGVNGAMVKVIKNGQSYNPDETSNNGKYIFNSVPKGMCKIRIQKQGYQTVEQSYNMPTYTAKKNIGLSTN
ncbi:MAG: carboxypeptidase regulatory-like domain-containing protein [Saprospiraceae bacterium]|nr:carboxypeptidase regulatory-like domain-containing protein [Saprospiraceae bacterium]